MKEYYEYFSGWFETNEKEVLALEKTGIFNPAIFYRNLEKLRNHFCGKYRDHETLDIVDYTIRKVPQKRNKWDCSVLLCVKLSNGEFLAKRHNNSQWLSLEW